MAAYAVSPVSSVQRILIGHFAGLFMPPFPQISGTVVVARLVIFLDPRTHNVLFKTMTGRKHPGQNSTKSKKTPKAEGSAISKVERKKLEREIMRQFAPDPVPIEVAIKPSPTG